MKEDGGQFDHLTAKLRTIVNKAASLGHTMEDETLVRKLLNVVPDRYLQIVTSIEQYSDLDEMTIEEVIGRLKTYEERVKYKKRPKQWNNQVKLMFTRLRIKEVLLEDVEVSLHEEDVGYKETNMDSLWYLDNGASNHMIGVREHFKELDEKALPLCDQNPKEAGMIDCNETLIPMDPGTRLTKITEGTMVNSTEYRSLIGCLRNLLHTRPDLSYSIRIT
ncbi:zinc finger, CCHC-type containing protein [Tanacetum coccineum]